MGRGMTVPRITALSLLAAACALLSCGCVSTDPGPAFSGVEDAVNARTSGRARVRWSRDAAGDAESARAVAGILRRGPLSAEAAARVALLNNRALQAEFEAVGIAHADFVQASLLTNPEFSASLRLPSRPPSFANTEFALAGNIVELFLLPMRKRVAAGEIERARLHAAGAALGLIAEAKAAFYTLQARQQLRTGLRLLVETNAAAADLAQRQHVAGNINDLDLATAGAAAAQARVDVLQTEAQIRADRERLNRLLGLAGGEELNWRVADRLPPIPAEEASRKNLETLALARRVDLLAARRTVDAIGEALALRTKTRYLPTALKLGVDTEREPDRTRLTGPTLDLELPIFDQGQGAIAKLAAQFRQARRQLEAAETDARSEVRAARDLLAARRTLAETYRRTLLPQQRLIVDQTQLQYNAMQAGGAGLLAARERQLNTERLYLEAWRDYWLARVELERALAGGGPVPGHGESTNEAAANMRGGGEGTPRTTGQRGSGH